MAWLNAQQGQPPRKRETREISRAMNAVINGLSSTLDDIADKSQRVLSEYAARSGPARTEVLVKFAVKAIYQTSEMVSKSPQYAWPLAATICEVAKGAPDMHTVMMGLMQSAGEGCPLSVPLYVSYKVHGKALDKDAWCQQNGYRCEAAPCPGSPLVLAWPLLAGVAGLLQVAQECWSVPRGS